MCVSSSTVYHKGHWRRTKNSQPNAVDVWLNFASDVTTLLLTARVFRAAFTFPQGLNIRAIKLFTLGCRAFLCAFSNVSRTASFHVQLPLLACANPKSFLLRVCLKLFLTTKVAVQT